MVRWIYWWEFSMVSNNPVRFSGHSSPVSGDIMVFVSRVDISRPHDQSWKTLWFSTLCFKRTWLKNTEYYIDNSAPGYTWLKQQLLKNLKVTFASLSKNDGRKEKEKARSCWWLKHLRSEPRICQREEPFVKKLLHHEHFLVMLCHSKTFRWTL